MPGFFCLFLSCRFLVKKVFVLNGRFHLLVKDDDIWTFNFFLTEVSLEVLMIIGFLGVFILVC
jgi:hypothetical protein